MLRLTNNRITDLYDVSDKWVFEVLIQLYAIVHQHILENNIAKYRVVQPCTYTLVIDNIAHKLPVWIQQSNKKT